MWVGGGGAGDARQGGLLGPGKVGCFLYYVIVFVFAPFLQRL